MRTGLFIACVVLAATGCVNNWMTVEFVSASASGAGGHWFIGAERGETIELAFELDARDVPDPAGWSVEIDGPGDADATIALTGQRTVGAVTVPAITGGSFGKVDDQAFTFHLRDPDGTIRESREWAATIANPGTEARAWLWGAFWTADGERLVNELTCSSTMSVVAYVGGDLTAAQRVKIDVIDVDLVGSDEIIDSSTFALEPGKRIYESVIEEPCAGETGSDDSNNADPTFTATLLASDGTLIDTIAGPELD